MGKASEPPKCKACGKAHWGTCLDHSVRGSLSSRPMAASAAASSHRPAPQTKSGELPRVPAGRANGKKGVATEAAKKRGGSSAVEPLTSNQTVEGSTPSRRSKSRAKATKAGPRDHAQTADEADGVASRLSAGRTAQAGAGEPDPGAILATAEAAAAHLAPALTKRGTPRQRAPKGSVDRKAYEAEKQRKRRQRVKDEAARLKAGREGK